MKIEIISVGKFQNSSFEEIFKTYQKRLKNVEIKEIPTKHSNKTPVNEVKKQEAVAIKKLINDKNYLICLDEHGQEKNSQDFAKLIKNIEENQQKNLTFVIGGAFGIDKELLNSADLTLCLGRMTLPHMMARIVLIEQIYRAFSINSGHPYHKE